MIGGLVSAAIAPATPAMMISAVLPSVAQRTKNSTQTRLQQRVNGSGMKLRPMNTFTGERASTNVAAWAPSRDRNRRHRA